MWRVLSVAKTRSGHHPKLPLSAIRQSLPGCNARHLVRKTSIECTHIIHTVQLNKFLAFVSNYQFGAWSPLVPAADTPRHLLTAPWVGQMPVVWAPLVCWRLLSGTVCPDTVLWFLGSSHQYWAAQSVLQFPQFPVIKPPAGEMLLWVPSGRILTQPRYRQTKVGSGSDHHGFPTRREFQSANTSNWLKTYLSHIWKVLYSVEQLSQVHRVDPGCPAIVFRSQIVETFGKFLPLQSR